MRKYCRLLLGYVLAFLRRVVCLLAFHDDVLTVRYGWRYQGARCRRCGRKTIYYLD